MDYSLMVTDVRIRGLTDWHSIFAGAVPDSVRVRNGVAFKSIVGLAEPPAETRHIRNLANNGWLQLDSFALSEPPVVESYTTTWAQGGSVNLTAPDGIQAGDLLLVLAANGQTLATTVFDMAGFTKDLNSAIGAVGDLAVFTKIAVAGDIGAAKALTSDQSATIGGLYFRISGADSANPIDVLGTTSRTTSQPIDIQGVDTVTDNNLPIAFYGANVYVFGTTPSTVGWQFLAETGSSNAADFSMGAVIKPVQNVGSTGNSVVAYSGDNEADPVAPNHVMLSIRSANP